MIDNKSTKHTAENEEGTQVFDTLDDVDEESPEDNKLSIYGLADQLKNIITQYKMERAERKHESKK